MRKIENFLYHPFQESSFGFFMKDPSISANETNFILEYVDLYDQPIPPPLLSLIYFLVRLLLAIFGEYVNVKVFMKMNHDKGVLATSTKNIAITQMIALLTLLIMDTLNELVYPLHEILGEWFCWSHVFAARLVNLKIGFYSITSCVMRFVFIVHDKKVKAFGKEKAKTLLTYLGEIIPLFICMWGSIHFDKSRTRLGPNLSRCYGLNHVNFFKNLPTLDVLKKRFQGGHVESLDPVLATCIRISKIFYSIVLWLIGFNIVEGIINYKTLIYMNR